MSLLLVSIHSESRRLIFHFNLPYFSIKWGIMIILDIFSKISSCHKILFCPIVMKFVCIMLLGRHLILRRHMILGNHLMIIWYKLLLCIKVIPCRGILLSGRYVSNIRHILKTNHHMVVIYTIYPGIIIEFSFRILIYFHNIYLILVFLCDCFGLDVPLYFPIFIYFMLPFLEI